jgi:hypothetical protein
MKPTEVGIGQGAWDRPACTQILRKLRVVRSRESPAVIDTPVSRCHTQRSFGGDMHAFGLQGGEFVAYGIVLPKRQSNRRVGRARHRPELFRRDPMYFVSAYSQLFNGVPQRSNDAVQLRFPCIGDECNAHSRTLHGLHCNEVKDSKFLRPTDRDVASM